MAKKSKKALGAAMAGVMAVGAVAGAANTVVTQVKADLAADVKAAQAKLDHLSYSLHNNYLGLKNQPTWEIYAKDAQNLINKLPSGSAKSELQGRLDRANAMILAAASVNHAEFSIQKNFPKADNAAQWKVYTEKALANIKKVDEGKEYSDRTPILQNRIEKVNAFASVVLKLEDAREAKDVKAMEALKEEAADLMTYFRVEMNYKDLMAYDLVEVIDQRIDEANKAVDEEDTEAPVLSYDGETEIIVENGAEFILPVVTGTDNKDEAVEVTSVITDADGNKIDAIDTKVEGVYTITYSATDAAGNEAENVVVTVTVKKAKLTAEAVTAVNDTTVEVSGLADSIKEESLVGKTITLTAGETSLVATYKEESLNNGKAVFVLAKDEKLVDATTYTVSSEDINFAKAEFVAKVADAYAKTFEKVTTDVIAGGSATVYFSAKNQYGEDFKLTAENSDITAKVKLNGVPLLSSEYAYNDGEDNIVITKAVKENDVLDITLENKVGENTFSGAINYKVIKGEAPAATTISNLVAKYTGTPANGHTIGNSATEVLAGDEIILSVDVKDQYSNPFKVAAEGIRWVVSSGDANITKTTGDAIDKISDAQETFTFKAKEAGNVSISAFLPNGQKVDYNVTIGAKKLDSIDYVKSLTTSGFNNEDIVVGQIKQNEGAVLNIADIKFDVKATVTTDDTLTSNDVAVTAKYRKDVEKDPAKGTENDIVIVAKSTKVGKFTVTPYVGAAIDAEDVIKASSFDLTTTINQTVTSIDNITFSPAELKTGAEIKKDVVFRNTHGEVVVVENGQANAKLTPEGTTATITKDAENNKNVLTLKVADAKNYNLLITKGDVFRSINLTFVAPKVTTIDAGADITGVVAGDTVDKAKYSEIKFLDQDGVSTNVAKSGVKVTVTKPDGEALTNVSDLITLGKTYSVDKEGVVTFEDATLENEDVVAYKVLADSELAAGVYTVKIATADGKVSDEFKVTVGEARAVKTVDISASSTKLSLGGTATLTVVPKDQYGDLIAVETSEIKVLAGENAEAGVVSEKKVDGKLVGYTVTLTGNAKGIADTTVNIEKASKVVASNKISISVDAVTNLVDSIAIDKEDIKPLYSTKGKAATVNLETIAKDANGNNVSLVAEDMAWSVVSQTDADGKAVTEKVSVSAEGVVTAVTDFVGKAEIKVQTANKKVATITLNFDNAEAVAQKGTLVAVNAEGKDIDEDKEKAGIQVNLEKGSNIVFTISGIDQYGEKIDKVDLDATTTILVGDKSVIGTEINPADGTETITLTAKNVGTTNVDVQYKGQTVEIELVVKDAAK